MAPQIVLEMVQSVPVEPTDHHDGSPCSLLSLPRVAFGGESVCVHQQQHPQLHQACNSDCTSSKHFCEVDVGSISSSSSSSRSRPRPKPKLKPNPKQKADTEAGVVPVAEEQAGSQPAQIMLSGTLKQQFWELEVAGESPCKSVAQAVRVHHQQRQSGGSKASSEAVAPPGPPWRLVDAPVMAHEAVAPRLEPPIVSQRVLMIVPRRVQAMRLIYL